MEETTKNSACHVLPFAGSEIFIRYRGIITRIPVDGFAGTQYDPVSGEMLIEYFLDGGKGALCHATIPVQSEEDAMRIALELLERLSTMSIKALPAPPRRESVRPGKKKSATVPKDGMPISEFLSKPASVEEAITESAPSPYREEREEERTCHSRSRTVKKVIGIAVLAGALTASGVFFFAFNKAERHEGAPPVSSQEEPWSPR